MKIHVTKNGNETVVTYRHGTPPKTDDARPYEVVDSRKNVIGMVWAHSAQEALKKYAVSSGIPSNKLRLTK